MLKTLCMAVAVVAMLGSAAKGNTLDIKLTPTKVPAKVQDDDVKGRVAPLAFKITVPNVVGKSFADATAALKQAGLTMDAGGKTTGIIASQDPAANAKVASNSSVKVTTRNPTITGIKVSK